MTTDLLIERLRLAANNRVVVGHTKSSLCADAAREIEQMRRDSARYRWLRDKHPSDEGLWVAMGVPHSQTGISCRRGDELDDAIDAEKFNYYVDTVLASGGETP